MGAAPLWPMPERANGSRVRESVMPVWTGSSVVVFFGRTETMPGLLEPDGVEFMP